MSLNKAKLPSLRDKLNKKEEASKEKPEPKKKK